MSEFLLVPCAKIKIDRESRQRKEIVTDDLEPSIAKRGVLQPIIIDENYTLIAGERRLTACLRLGLAEIPVRFKSELSQIEREIIELEENVRRKAISWQEEVRAVGSIHKKLSTQSPDWTLAKTAEETGYKVYDLSRLLKVSREIDDERINKLDTFATAYNMIMRREERKTQDAIADIMQITKEEILSEPEKVAELPAPATLSYPLIISPVESILIEDFTKWIKVYSGPTFNFVHCDFPYGVGLFEGKWSGRETSETYDDSASTYWELLRVFCENINSFMSHSAHLMFWYSMEYHAETLKFFVQNAPSLSMQPRPLVWLKSDNAGICPDPQRGPRYIVETALIGSREDRRIVKTVSNGIAAPTDKRYHPSTKPEPVLRHFFQMFVDESTKLFDPTCGSAAALRAAESLGAEFVLGLEISPTIAEGAREALRDFRLKSRAAAQVRS